MATLAAPKAVSPFIRFCRWGALLSGVVYGSSRLKSLSAKEEVLQVEITRKKEARALRIAGERKAAETAELNALAKEIGINPTSS